MQVKMVNMYGQSSVLSGTLTVHVLQRYSTDRIQGIIISRFEHAYASFYTHIQKEARTCSKRGVNTYETGHECIRNKA